MDLQFPLIFYSWRWELDIFSSTREKLSLVWLVWDEDNSGGTNVSIGTYLEGQSQKNKGLLTLSYQT